MIFSAVVVVLTAWAGLGGAGQSPADLLIHGGTIYTLGGAAPTVEAVAVSGGRIVFAGNLSAAEGFAGEGTRWIDLAGKTMIPGLVDAHAHLRSLGKYLSELQLETTRSAADVRAMVLEAQKSAPPGRWIEGRGWDQNDWAVKEFPTWKDFEGTGANPVYLRRVDGHAGWVNRAALELCGITRDTPDPEGGKIVRDEHGEPTGVFIDNAKDLITDHIADPTPAQIDEWLAAAVRHCNSLGLTGMHDAGTAAEDLESFRRLDERGLLTLRVYCMLSTDDKDLAFTEEQIRLGPREQCGGKVVVRAVKLYADGALGSRGAAMLSPYSDDPGNTGLLVDRPEELERLTRLALENGYQACTHAIGDKGNRVILDAYEKALEGRPGAERRLRVEHAQVVSLDDIPRFRRLGVIPAMQPTHCTSDMYWAEDRLGPERVRGAYAWREFLDAGNPLPLGSDFPVESANPLWGIYAAVTRQDREGWPVGGWYPDQRMTALEAVEGFTIDAAFAAFAEEQLGTIEVGKRADFTVVDRDILRAAPREILDAAVTHTVVAGEVVYASGD